tara:strand:- start:968 stop:1264 length:297 start_codon:yes stop_codon:yes gene_type:complete
LNAVSFFLHQHPGLIEALLQRFRSAAQTQMIHSPTRVRQKTLSSETSNASGHDDQNTPMPQETPACSAGSYYPKPGIPFVNRNFIAGFIKVDPQSTFA